MGINRFSEDIIRLAIIEDIGQGDITSLLIVSEDIDAKAHIIAKEDFMLAGMPFVKDVFNIIDPDIALNVFYNEGSFVKRGDIIAEVSGCARNILAGERIALNILQRVSGIATITNSYAERIKGLHARIADTRKTVPGMRFMEKYGVRIGGGVNHRFGLYDGVLIKDNHLKIAGSIKKAVELARKAHHLLKIEVEVKDIEEFKQALESGVDVIMLDNMPIDDIKKAVNIINSRSKNINGKVLLEVSGSVSLDNVRDIAETGVDIISIGALTHSARAVDISMKII